MADVFISYAQSDRRLAESLSSELEGHGFSTWWDANLLGGDAFAHVIQKQLAESGVILVIWSPRSIASEWVYAEAHTARRLTKLVPIITAELAPEDVPPPFNAFNMICLEDTQAIVSTLQRRIHQLQSPGMEAQRPSLLVAEYANHPVISTLADAKGSRSEEGEAAAPELVVYYGAIGLAILTTAVIVAINLQIQ